MAHKKGQGSSKNGRESHSKRLGVKLFGGEVAIPGNIIIRQRGTKFHPGDGVGMGKDHTIFATREGLVSFRKTRGNRSFVSVLPFDTDGGNGTVAAPAPKKEAKTVAPKKEAAPAPADTPTTKATEEAKPAKKATKKASGDDLKKINGVGPAFAKRLNAMGIQTYADLAGLTVDDAAALEEKHDDPMTSPDQWQEWIDQAKELMG